MVINDDERRKVAAKLREPKESLWPYADDELIRLRREVGCVPRQDLYERIADLVDRPTCHLVLTDTETHGNAKVRIYECSECGRTCEEIYGKYERCPHCGAEVVADD